MTSLSPAQAGQPADRRAMPTGPFVKIYGLQRSGTNFLEWLIRKNFAKARVLVDETGWKHGPVPDAVDWRGLDWSDPEWSPWEKRAFAARRRNRLGPALADLRAAVERGDLRTCMIAKDPYSWWVSYARYQGRPSSPVEPRAVRLWADLNRHWRGYAAANERRTLFLRYEDLLAAPSEGLSAIGVLLGLPPSRPAHPCCRQAIGPIGARPTPVLFDRDYYRDKRYLDALAARDFDIINAHLPTDLLAMLGYEVRHG